LLARDRGVRQPAAGVFVALVALWGELGLREPVFAAPVRLVADYSGVSRDGVAASLGALERAGLVAISKGRDPSSGRPITVVRLISLAGTAPTGT